MGCSFRKTPRNPFETSVKVFKPKQNLDTRQYLEQNEKRCSHIIYGHNKLLFLKKNVK